jgi:hypothetical protein
MSLGEFLEFVLKCADAVVLLLISNICRDGVQIRFGHREGAIAPGPTRTLL